MAPCLLLLSHQHLGPPPATGCTAVNPCLRPHALQRLPSCLLLHCAAADLEEQQGRLPAARAVYEDLVHGRTPVPAEPEAGEIPEERAPLQLPAELGTLAWLQFMALVRRTDSVKAARQVFLRALKDPAHGWQVGGAVPGRQCGRLPVWWLLQALKGRAQGRHMGGAFKV